jgi:glycosyltransferase involved in cell wall biosynthesis
MKVAFFVSDRSPIAGGSYTFEERILKGILTLSPSSNHTFVLYVWGDRIPAHLEQMRSTSVEIVCLNRSFSERMKSKLERTVAAISAQLRDPSRNFKIEGWYERYILNYFAVNRVDLTLSLTLACPIVDYPYITTVFDLQHRLQSYFPEVSINGEWDRREQSYLQVLRRATFILTGTEVGKAEIEQFYQIPSSRIKVIPFPTPQFTLPSEIDRDRILKKYHLPSNYLLYPAQFWSHKNHVGLLMAIECLQKKYHLDFSLVLIGADKGNEAYVKEMVEKLDLSKQVHFLGFVPQVEMAPLYQNAFALTFVTFFGPDNLPPLEAMALGCPVIASRVSGAEEQLGDSALLVDPTQPEEIALAIKSLWEDPDLRQSFIDRGFVRANKWSTKDYVKELFSVIDDFEAIRRCWK